jgi:carbonic anhydrase/acetyltransferase-like protein (isoleucine patch superfamily)
VDAYFLQTEALISPFGDPVSQSPVQGRPLREVMRQAALDAGAQATHLVAPDQPLPTEAERLLLTDDLWATTALLKAFLKEARRLQRPCALVMGDNLLTDFTGALQDLGRVQGAPQPQRRYPLVWLPPGAAPPGRDLARAQELEPLELDLQLKPLELPVHRVFSEDEKLVLPMTHLACVRIGHWMHILRANQMAQIAWGAQLFTEPWRLLWAAARAMSFNKWRVMQKLVVKGRNCDIHPSAVVEASVLGDNVSVGANAVVRYSCLGDGARVSDQCNVLSSVLGPGASGARMGMLQSCVLYEGANSGHYGLQLCLVGEQTFVGGEVILGDFKPGGEVMVMHRGELVSTGTNLLGCAVGHGCKVMMRATFYAGREIPNGYTVIGPPRDIVARVPADLPAGPPLIAHDGVLEPYDQWRQGVRRKKES